VWWCFWVGKREREGGVVQIGWLRKVSSHHKYGVACAVGEGGVQFAKSWVSREVVTQGLLLNNVLASVSNPPPPPPLTLFPPPLPPSPLPLLLSSSSPPPPPLPSSPPSPSPTPQGFLLRPPACAITPSFANWASSMPRYMSETRVGPSKFESRLYHWWDMQVVVNVAAGRP